MPIRAEILDARNLFTDKSRIEISKLLIVHPETTMICKKTRVRT